MKPRTINFTRASFSAALLTMAVAVAGCASNGPYPLDTLSPKSDLTRAILTLFKEVTILDTIVLIVVIIAMIGAIFVYSSREGDPGEPSAMHSDVTLEMLWTVIPAVILVAITVPTVHTIIRTQPNSWPADTLEVKVIAHQWWWEFKYPSFNNVDTADEVHIPVHRTIHFAMVSKDVIHSFFMPSIGGKRDVVPGQENQITLTADIPGEYYGQCTEYCGTSHANMRFRVFVDTPEDFAKWVAHQNEIPVKPTEGPAAAGAKIWADAPCSICHTIKGVSGFSKEYTYGFRGPDLTHFGSRGTLAGSIFKNTPENVAMWIKDPDKVKPGANMPTLGLDDQQLSDLVAYLESLK
jgi:cytochrome c oxidase subunit II